MRYDLRSRLLSDDFYNSPREPFFPRSFRCLICRRNANPNSSDCLRTPEADLYIDLLKQCLCASIYDESAWAILAGPMMPRVNKINPFAYIPALIKHAILRALRKRSLMLKCAEISIGNFEIEVMTGLSSVTRWSDAVGSIMCRPVSKIYSPETFQGIS